MQTRQELKPVDHPELLFLLGGLEKRATKRDSPKRAKLSDKTLGLSRCRDLRVPPALDRACHHRDVS